LGDQTREYLGTIIQEGIIPPKHKREIKTDSLFEYETHKKYLLRKMSGLWI